MMVSMARSAASLAVAWEMSTRFPAMIMFWRARKVVMGWINVSWFSAERSWSCIT